MTSPDVRPRSLAMFAATVFGWIVWLSLVLRFLFGAEMTGGWFLVGILFTAMACGFMLILNEIYRAVEEFRLDARRLPRRRAKSQWKGRPVPPRPVLTLKSFDLGANARAYRIALGLNPRVSANNRRRHRLPAH